MKIFNNNYFILHPRNYYVNIFVWIFWLVVTKNVVPKVPEDYCSCRVGQSL